MSENIEENVNYLAALEWHLMHGADDLMDEEPQDRTKIPDIPKTSGHLVATPDTMKPNSIKAVERPNTIVNFQDNATQESLMGAAEAIKEAKKLAANCDSLEKLKNSIMEFDGLSIKKTASNLVFADGHENAKIILIGEAPGADEDMQGKPFIGMSGQLLDKILGCIDLSRSAEDLKKAVYITNVLNWRPPGNRTPTVSEMNISLPFIQRHIEIINPDILIICGGTAAKELLQVDQTISKLRGKFHDYKMNDHKTIPAMVTYHPAYLLQTPAQKKAVWHDMLMFQEKLKDL